MTHADLRDHNQAKGQTEEHKVHAIHPAEEDEVRGDRRTEVT